MERRGFLAELAAGVVVSLAGTSSWAAVEGVSKSVSSFPALFGTKEYFIGSTVKKLPRARAAFKLLEAEIASDFAQAVVKAVPVSAVSGGEAWMLDSLIRDVVPHQKASHYRPTVSLSGPRLYPHIALKA